MNRPKFIDTHAHVHFAAYKEDMDEVINRSLENGTWMINVGTKKETSQDAYELTEKYQEGVYAIVGLHPVHTNKSFHDEEELGKDAKPFNSSGETFDKDFYLNLAKQDKVVGIGECGLDFFRIPEGEEGKIFIERQKVAFKEQIEIAIEVDKPLMIHCREAYPEVLNILKEYKKEAGDKLRGNFHFFAGTLDETKEILDLGFTLSFTGVITFAEDYKKLVEFTPIDKIMSETDCPYVTPVPYRGQRNEPVYVNEVVKKIAEIKNLDFEEVRDKLVSNAFEFYNLT